MSCCKKKNCDQQCVPRCPKPPDKIERFFEAIMSFEQVLVYTGVATQALSTLTTPPLGSLTGRFRIKFSSDLSFARYQLELFRSNVQNCLGFDNLAVNNLGFNNGLLNNGLLNNGLLNNNLGFGLNGVGSFISGIGLFVGRSFEIGSIITPLLPGSNFNLGLGLNTTAALQNGVLNPLNTGVGINTGVGLNTGLVAPINNIGLGGLNVGGIPTGDVQVEGIAPGTASGVIITQGTILNNNIITVTSPDQTTTINTVSSLLDGVRRGEVYVQLNGLGVYSQGLLRGQLYSRRTTS